MARKEPSRKQHAKHFSEDPGAKHQARRKARSHGPTFKEEHVRGWTLASTWATVSRMRRHSVFSVCASCISLHASIRLYENHSPLPTHPPTHHPRRPRSFAGKGGVALETQTRLMTHCGRRLPSKGHWQLRKARLQSGCKHPTSCSCLGIAEVGVRTIMALSEGGSQSSAVEKRQSVTRTPGKRAQQVCENTSFDNLEPGRESEVRAGGQRNMSFEARKRDWQQRLRTGFYPLITSYAAPRWTRAQATSLPSVGSDDAGWLWPYLRLGQRRSSAASVLAKP